MAQGSGSAAAAAAVLWLLVLRCAVAQARVFTVGDDRGWTFNVTSWTKGKRFHAGDLLVFKYPAEAHDVVLLRKRVAYKWCLKTRKSKVYQTGYERIKLSKGYNYFICSFPQHCQSGMKISIKAT